MASLRGKVVLIGIVSLITWAFSCFAFLNLIEIVSTLLECFVLAISCTLSLALPSVIIVTFDLWRCDPSESHSYRSMWDHYVIGWYRYVTGYRQWGKLRDRAQHAAVTQEECLLHLVRVNQNTSYGKEHVFKSVESVEDFVMQHPLTDYSYYEPYVNQIMNGEENILTPEHVRYLGVTSGTTGNGKKFPILRSVVKEMLEVVSMTSYANKQHFPNAFRLQKSLRVTPPLVAKEGPNKLLIGPYSVSVTPKKLETFTTPSIANDIYDEMSLTYIHALFGLRERNLRILSFLLPCVAHRFIATLEKHWKSLCDDIEKGTLKKHLNISTEMRDSLEELLRPDPARANEARAELRCCQTNIFRRLWPKLDAIELFTSGTFKSAAIGLKRRYFGHVTVASNYHASTEGFYGTNLNLGEKDPIYTPLVCHTFYEFIPIDEVMKENPKTIIIEDEPEIGTEYELVVTTNRCIYRYRTGDIIKICGYFDELPQYQFMYRLDQTISLAGERTTEADIQDAILKVLEDIPQFTVVDYTVTDSARLKEKHDDAKPSYILLIEVQLQPHGDKRERLTDLEKQMFDEALQEVSSAYHDLREKDELGPLRVIQLKKWSFLELKDFMKATNEDIAIAHYKTPKYAKGQTTVDFLIGQELSSMQSSTE